MSNMVFMQKSIFDLPLKIFCDFDSTIYLRTISYIFGLYEKEIVLLCISLSYVAQTVYMTCGFSKETRKKTCSFL